MTLIEDPPTTGPALSNMEACARVVAKLAMEGFIPQRQLTTAAHAIQIPVRMIIDAVDQIARNGYRAPAQRIHVRTVVIEALRHLRQANRHQRTGRHRGARLPRGVPATPGCVLTDLGPCTIPFSWAQSI